MDELKGLLRESFRVICWMLTGLFVASAAWALKHDDPGVLLLQGACAGLTLSGALRLRATITSSAR